MRHLFTIIITTVICLGVASCEPAHVRETISHASAIMHDRPDSALTLMESIDPSEIHRGETRALHALYLTQARNKNHIIQTDDSLINIALDHFDDETRPYEAMLAHFYRGEIHFDAKDYYTAATEALTALQLAKYDDHYNLAKIHDLMADIHHSVFNLGEALVHRRQAAAYFGKTKRRLHHLYAECEVAREYCGNKQYKEAIDYLDSIAPLFVEADSAVTGLFYDSYMIPLAKLKKPHEAIEKFHTVRKFWDIETNETYDFAYIAELFIDIGQIDSAYHYLHMAERLNKDKPHNIKYHATYHTLYKQTNQLDSALWHLEALDDINTRADANSVAKAEREFFNSLAIDEHKKSERHTLMFIFLAGIIAIGMATGIMFHRAKIRKHRIQIHELEIEHEEMERQLLNLRKEIDHLNDERIEYDIKINALSLYNSNMEDASSRQTDIINKLLKNQFSSLNSLCTIYFDKRDSASIASTFVNDFEKELKRLQSSDALKKIRKIVNDARNNILTRLKEQIPSLKQPDLDFIALYLCELSYKTICLILDMNVGNYYNKRKRIRERIEKSDSPDKEFFLQHIR